MDLKDKRALITGGTSGMGIATARAMAEKGASVIITGRDETRGASAAEEIRAGGHDAQFIAADFSEMSEVGRVADAAGEIDVLVNGAGFAALGPTVDTDEAAFDGLFQINVKAPFFLVAALAPKIAARGGGSIINISTMVASYGQPGMAAYGASRAAIELLTKAWAAEFGPQNVRVNAVAPGPTLTPAMEPRLAMATEFAKTIPLRRIADVHELSDVITFLATPAAGYINGAIIPVDGGRPRSERGGDEAGHHSRTFGPKPLGRPLTILLARNPDKASGLRAGNEITARTDVGELRWNTSTHRPVLQRIARTRRTVERQIRAQEHIHARAGHLHDRQPCLRRQPGPGGCPRAVRETVAGRPPPAAGPRIASAPVPEVSCSKTHGGATDTAVRPLPCRRRGSQELRGFGFGRLMT